MSLAQLTAAASYVGTTVKFQFTSVLPASNSLTLMAWTYHTGGTGDAYSDIGGLSDDNNVASLQSHVVTGTRRLSLGDLNTDTDSATAWPDNEWHHVCMVLTPNGANVDARAYMDGILQVSKAGILSPSPPTSLRLWNTRASTTDAGGQWIGHACAFKVWDFPLTERQILDEMRYWRAQTRQGLYAEVPCFDLDGRTLITGGRGVSSMTVTGTFSNGFDPPGVLRDAPWTRREPARYFSIPDTLMGQALL